MPFSYTAVPIQFYDANPLVPHSQISKSLSKKEIMTIHQKRPGPCSQTAVETTYKTFYEYVFSTGILEQSMRTRNQGEIGRDGQTP